MFETSKVKCVLIFSLLNIIFSYSFADEINHSIKPAYHWGRGLKVPSADLNLGGYINIAYEQHESKQDIIELDDLSLFISWSPHSQVRFFAELEMESLISTDGIANFSESFSLERLYVDFLATESFSIRFGQFLTPVGRWNTTHAAPLVWTTSRPIATESHFFPSRSNGLMLTKQFVVNDHDLDISVYFDDSADLDVRKIENTFKNKHTKHEIDHEVAFEYAIGTHIIYEPISLFKTSFSYLAFKKHADEKLSTNHLLGLDLFWQDDGYEMQMELAYRTAADEQGSETSTYIQGIVPITYNMFAVGRYEFINGTHQLSSGSINGTTHVGVPALAWRPYSPLVLKAEYRFGNNNKEIAPSGFFTSVSMLF